MKPFQLDLAGLVIRFYLMMGVILLAGFTGQWWLALLGLPIFLSAMMGISFGSKKENKKCKVVTFQQKKTIKSEKRAIV